MKVFRFMSINEFKKYINGSTLINNKNHHQKYNRRTNSIGFCFFNLDEYKPEKAVHFLTGIVNLDICVVFEVNEEKLKETYGIYAKQDINISIFDILIGKIPSFEAKEYCTTEYSNKDFKLVKYAIPEWSNKEQWKWKNI